MQKGDDAVEKFSSGYNCAQAVLYSFADDLGLERDTAFKDKGLAEICRKCVRVASEELEKLL